MTVEKLVEHYTTMPDMIWFILVSTAVLTLMHLFLWMLVKLTEPRYKNDLASQKSLSVKFATQCEKYYELMFASTSMLFFIGLYFWISYHYFRWSDAFYSFWDKYSDILLLIMLVVAVMMTNIMDSLAVHLRMIRNEEKATLRMAAMLYMLIVFAYIKFIYEDNNYDEIIFYFIVMLIGRFVYFDASFMDFVTAVKNVFLSFHTLLLVLCTTGLMALYGFTTGYLVRGHSVVVCLWISHVFLIVEICIVYYVSRFLYSKKRMKTKRKNHPAGNRVPSRKS